jgi:hypothetical protein
VLYIPDEWRHNCDDTYIECVNLLAQNKVDKVDYAFIHGQFDYQLGDIIPDRLKHKVSNFEKIIRKKVFCNHIHNYSEHGIVIAPGSIERLSQAEQTDKGFVIFKDNKDGCDATFIINTNSVKHHTLNINISNTQEAIEYIKEKIKKLRVVDGDCIRIKCNQDNPIRYSVKELQSNWPNINFNVEVKTKKTITDSKKEVKKHNMMTINKQSLPTLLREQMIANGVSPEIIQKSMELLNGVL